MTTLHPRQDGPEAVAEREIGPDESADPAQSRPEPARATPGSAARIYHATVMHQRNSNAPGAVTRRFSYTSYFWLVDVDALPVLPRWLRPFARFRVGDHLGDPRGTLAGNARALLVTNDLSADRILLLTCPRVAGHVFNPLSVFYCLSGDDLVAVIAEVHNTYGGRHVYLLRPDESGRDQVGKEFYVSPFLPMGGTYLMRTPLPADRLSVSIALRQDDATPFVATLSGAGRAATTRAVLGSLARWPLVTLRTSALIRWQGIRLWLRRVPVQPRPADATLDERGR
ncbi:MAG TPA: DUF1365 domain-containing protein [Nakamurella sp.]|nr:DUF1365 domain-containing protein [Nakamurella sp.]